MVENSGLLFSAQLGISTARMGWAFDFFFRRQSDTWRAGDDSSGTDDTLKIANSLDFFFSLSLCSSCGLIQAYLVHVTSYEVPGSVHIVLAQSRSVSWSRSVSIPFLFLIFFGLSIPDKLLQWQKKYILLTICYEFQIL